MQLKNTLGLLLGIIPVIVHANLGDYGDAPDEQPAGYAIPFHNVVGKFPTLFNTTNSRFNLPGGHTLDSSQEHLGKLESIEIDANDPTDPDGVENFINDDFDDGLVGFPCPTESPSLPSTTLGFYVTIEPTAPPTTRYLNVLIDINNDGIWSNSQNHLFSEEWVVKDFPINIAPGNSKVVSVPAFSYPSSPLAKWMRVSLTRIPVSGTFTDDGSGWDGSGTFNYGEIEDFLITNYSYFANDFAYKIAHDFDNAAQNRKDNAKEFAEDAKEASIKAEKIAETTAISAAIATTHASAISASLELVENYVVAATQECLNASATAEALAESCAHCPCATACAKAEVSAAFSLQACAEALAVSEAMAIAVAAAASQASAQSIAAAEAEAIAKAEAEAIAKAEAKAIAHADAAAIAAASASSAAIAVANAKNKVITAACEGNLEIITTETTQAQANATASASAMASAVAEADAIVNILTEVATKIEAITIANANAIAAAEANALAIAMTETAVSTAATAVATTQLIATFLTSQSGSAVAFCSPDCGENFCPGLVTLDYSTATNFQNETNSGTYLKWKTSTEKDSIGFHILRQVIPKDEECPNGLENYTRLTNEKGNNIWIWTLGNQNSENSYSYIDLHENEINYCYILEDIDSKGKSTYYPISKQSN